MATLIHTGGGNKPGENVLGKLKWGKSGRERIWGFGRGHGIFLNPARSAEEILGEKKIKKIRSTQKKYKYITYMIFRANFTCII